MIIANEFPSAQQLAAFLHALNANDSAYLHMLQHKTTSKIGNENLVRAMSQRFWGAGDGTEDDGENFVEAYECFLCKEANRKTNQASTGHSPSRPDPVDSRHYNCSMPTNPVTKKQDSNNWWLQYWKQSRIEAETIHHFALINANYTSEDFSRQVLERYTNL